MSEVASPTAPSASTSDVTWGLHHSSIAGLPNPMPVSTRTTPSGCRMTYACTGNGSNVACSGYHSGTEVTVASISRSIGGSFDQATQGNLLLDLPSRCRECGASRVPPCSSLGSQRGTEHDGQVSSASAHSRLVAACSSGPRGMEMDSYRITAIAGIALMGLVAVGCSSGLRMAAHLDGDLAARDARRCVPLGGKVRRLLLAPADSGRRRTRAAGARPPRTWPARQ